MLELDYIFNEFLEKRYKNLTDSQQDDFLTFLGNDDPDLFAWLMGYRQPESEADSAMIKIIKGLI